MILVLQRLLMTYFGYAEKMVLTVQRYCRKLLVLWIFLNR